MVHAWIVDTTVLVTQLVLLVTSIVTLIKTRETHHLINSRMDKLLQVSNDAARAEGVITGAAQKRDRQTE